MSKSPLQASHGAVLLAAPASRQGKTSLTLALTRALARQGDVAAAKSGPDYIDPRFHDIAARRTSPNLDPWAMSTQRLRSIVAQLARDAQYILIESAMGLFDGPDGAAGVDLAAALDIPVVLIVDASAQGQSIGAVVHGFVHWRRRRFRRRLAGVIFNRVAGARHEAMLRSALDDEAPPCLGVFPVAPQLALSHRHLGLRQACEIERLDERIDIAADIAEKYLDLEALKKAMRPPRPPDRRRRFELMAPPGRIVALARDRAFAFVYPHLLDDWRAQGADIRHFSPLDDQPPDAEADAVFLPGGYPELHAARLAAAAHFRSAMHEAARRGVAVYGECGGYMTLGRALRDAQGRRHRMLGLLPMETAMGDTRAALGYRIVRSRRDRGAVHRAHEFHYATQCEGADVEPLFVVADADDRPLGHAGAICGSVGGSFLHLIDRAPV